MDIVAFKDTFKSLLTVFVLVLWDLIMQESLISLSSPVGNDVRVEELMSALRLWQTLVRWQQSKDFHRILKNTLSVNRVFDSYCGTNFDNSFQGISWEVSPGGQKKSETTANSAKRVKFVIPNRVLCEGCSWKGSGGVESTWKKWFCIKLRNKGWKKNNLKMNCYKLIPIYY